MLRSASPTRPRSPLLAPPAVPAPFLLAPQCLAPLAALARPGATPVFSLGPGAPLRSYSWPRCPFRLPYSGPGAPCPHLAGPGAPICSRRWPRCPPASVLTSLFSRVPSSSDAHPTPACFPFASSRRLFAPSLISAPLSPFASPAFLARLVLRSVAARPLGGLALGCACAVCRSSASSVAPQEGGEMLRKFAVAS